MTASVRLSVKAAKALAKHLEDTLTAAGAVVSRELDAAIRKAERSSTVRKQLAAPKVAKRKAKRQRTKDVRALVVERACGKCEACGESFFLPPSLDHFFGRARAESLATCWLLCRYCDREKTDNTPSASFWLARFAKHCRAHGYVEAAVRAEKRLAWIEARAGYAP